MKKIKLKESDIERLVKKIIKEDNLSEIDKKTWASAAEKARDRGMGKLGDKFASHSREHGTSVVDSVTFDVDGIGFVKIVNFVDFTIGNDSYFVGETETGRRHRFFINDNERKKTIITYLGGDSLAWPATVKDAKNYLSLLNDNGMDTFGIRPKQITSGYVNENKKGKKTIKEAGGYDSPMELGKHSSGYMKIVTEEVDSIIDSLTELELILPEIMDDDLHKSLDSFLEKASTPLESLNEEIENTSGRMRDRFDHWSGE